MIWTTDSIRTLFTKTLAQKSEWQEEIFNVGTIYTLINVIAEGIYKLVTFFENWVFESTWEYAQSYYSRISQAKSRNYFPKRKIGATGFVKVSPIEDFTISSYTYMGPNVVFTERKIWTTETDQLTVFSTEKKVFRNGSILKNLLVDNTSAVNLGGNKVAIPVTSHGIAAGTEIAIKGTENYNGLYTVLSTSTTNYIHISTSYKEETFIGSEQIASGYLWIPVKQGLPKQQTIVATGAINETFDLVTENSDQYYLTIYNVDSNNNILSEVTILEEQDDLYFVQNTTSYYCQINNDPTFSKVTIKFGDGITSKKTIAGDRFLIIYADTEGENGNITSAGLITQILQPPLDVAGNSVTFYYTNDFNITGGSNWESTINIKKNAERLFYTGYRPGGDLDYTTIVESHPDVQKAIVWNWYDIGNGTLPIQGTERQNEIFITGVTETGTEFSSILSLDLLENYLKDRPKNDLIRFEALNKLGIKFVIDATVENINRNIIENNLTTSLNNSYDILNIEFNQSIYESNYVAVIDDTVGIIKHTAQAFYVQENEDTIKNLDPIKVSYTSSDDSDPTKQIYLSQDTFEIWIKRKINGSWETIKQIASTTGTIISGIGSWDVVGSVTYASNSITYQLFDIISNIPPSGETDYAPQWATATSYVIGERVVYLEKMYECNTNHTSTTFVADSAYWTYIMDSTFGERNPDDIQPYGYLVYLIYTTEDGNGNQTQDLRLSKFNQIFDFNSELLIVNPTYI